MRCDFFRIPAVGGADEATQLNAHLGRVRVLTVDRQFVSDGANSYWSICVQSLPASDRKDTQKKAPVDYKQVLSPEDFTLFAQLRDLRKVIAEQEAIPPYSVFTNEQLARMVETRTHSLAGLAEIDGIGPARIEKYGRRFLDAMSVNGRPAMVPTG